MAITVEDAMGNRVVAGCPARRARSTPIVLNCWTLGHVCELVDECLVLFEIFSH